MHPYIVLLRRLPLPPGTCRNTEVEELPHFRLDDRADNKCLGPDELRVERVAKMVGELLADRVPVGFLNRVVSFIIIPDRTGMDPD
jgi:hypothetical protein